MKLHLTILSKNGKKQFAILPYEEFVTLQHRLANLEDLTALRKAKCSEGRKLTIPLQDAKKSLDI